MHENLKVTIEEAISKKTNKPYTVVYLHAYGKKFIVGFEDLANKIELAELKQRYQKEEN